MFGKNWKDECSNVHNMRKKGYTMRVILAVLFLITMALSATIAAAGGDVVPEMAEVPLMLEETCTTFVCKVMDGFPEINAWLVAIFTFLAVFLRALAELVTFVGHRLNNEKTGKMGDKIESFSRWAAQILGWFGAGTPKVTKEKLEQKANGPKA